ncbi:MULTISPECIES: ABC transporter substrate-binding protein [Rhizobium/Agrobacterium group]|jgi:polar amino acid transport system substrate-binding protein|uniref:Amino acid ABC transporter, substrate binding protein n=3 Tax=Rhizobium/Agrobacterium group TaxID=227290 RepID=A0A1S7QXU0_9HYPH|nr:MULTISPECIES: ABC transporter substrate-binding protein [Rhizobium/Agrobacterium group]MCZ7468641.1 ABC transporter substrate-binding protein [Rhizobium rhizogenes]MCZ7480880.1 ABC transporter substrate-binding protein [Rhizobium rhizogenes]MCZ7488645.1 ABC transporter substrate-binding protein [Rhizobium rhizogenes]MDO3443515.1 ABC transporter substrate-binding protein [Agrobacterium sp. V1]TRA99784.1 transporter substrate-binding domain-containing protein [Rhizobium rhizogenes]
MNWKTITLTAALATSAAVLPAKADQLDTIMANKTLRCATFADVPPFASPDPKTREMAGFDVDLCGAIAKELGVKAEVKPVSVEARVPEVKLGRVDLSVANLAYTQSRAEQIQFSDPYYLAKEMLIVPVDDPGTKKSDFVGQRIASSKGSTSELSVKLNKSEPLTFQDTASAYLAVQQGKARGIVGNTMTMTKFVNESKTKGKQMRMIEEPMLFQPIGIGMAKDNPALTAKINEILRKLDADGEINRIWDKWLGPNTEYKMTRTDKVVPLSELKFDPIP